MSIYPANAAFNRFKAVELDPNALAHCRSFDKFDFATFGRGIEDMDSKGVQAGASDPNLGVQNQSARAARFRRTFTGGVHAQSLSEMSGAPKQSSSTTVP
jgi:hypothetical protein